MELPARLQADLLAARKARDEVAVTALRTALAALANAEAPPMPDAPSLGVAGLQEHDRLTLTDADHQRILRDEIQLRQTAIEQYDGLGQSDAADRLRAEHAVLRRYLS